MSKKVFKDYFPLISKGPKAPMKAYGAYDFLNDRGYDQQVNNIRNHPSYFPPKPAAIHDRRVMTVGLLYKKDDQYMKRTGNSLLAEFYELCWTEAHAPMQHRLARMNKWHQQYKEGYESRYGYLL